MITLSWILAIGAIAILAGCIVADEIKFDRDVREYERTRAARLRQLLGDIHKSL